MAKYIVVGNNQEWCYYSWRDYINQHNDSVLYFKSFIPVSRLSIINKLCNHHFTNKSESIVRNIFAPLYYWLILMALKTKIQETTFLIIYDWNVYTRELDLFVYIKKHLPKIKLVYIFTNIVAISGAKKNGIAEKLTDVFDYIYAFDKLDSKQYGFRFHPLIYAGGKLPQYNKLEYDVFYIGNAKDRLCKLHEVYKKCIEANLKCKFFIVGVPKEEQVYNGIDYNHSLTYGEALDYIARSRCIIDVIQGNSSAMTIKVCEAVLYDKKIITSNKNVKEEIFYHPNNILVYDDRCTAEVIEAFLNQNSEPYSNEDKQLFSPDLLLADLYSYSEKEII